ncbi:hypothetical protein EYS14_24180 [Alteromonadaceae bacterium M269]|nr:hypothetical protein EYS14_24180 [Alteromonadaceae bacterium M269]
MRNQNPNKKLLKSVLGTNASSLANSLGEFAIDQCITDAVLKDIPIVGTVLALYKAGNDAQAYLFAKKVLRFLQETESIPLDVRVKFVSELSESDKEKLGDNLLLLINNIRELNAAEYLGRCFSLLMTGKINHFTFYQYTHIIECLTPYLLQQIIFLYQHKNMAPVITSDIYLLSSYGLLDLDMSRPLVVNNLSTPSYKKTKIGQNFYDQIIITNEPVIPIPNG